MAAVSFFINKGFGEGLLNLRKEFDLGFPVLNICLLLFLRTGFFGFVFCGEERLGDMVVLLGGNFLGAGLEDLLKEGLLGEAVLAWGYLGVGLEEAILVVPFAVPFFVLPILVLFLAVSFSAKKKTNI